MFWYVVSIDDIGRVDTSLLPDQTLMELFIGSSLSLEPFQKADGEFRDLSVWPDVFFDTNGRPTKIIFDLFSGKKGSLKMCFEFIPSSVWLVSFESNEYESTVEFSAVPDSIQFFNGWENLMHGSVDLTRLPKAMRVLLLGRNNFSGTLDFTKLPSNLEALELCENSFSGIIDLRGIEKCISSLNQDRMQAIYDDDDELPGKAHLGINLQRNHFEGDIFVKSMTHILSTEPFRFTGNTSEWIIDAQDGKFSVHT